jgi:hypothetical protein
VERETERDREKLCACVCVCVCVAAGRKVVPEREKLIKQIDTHKLTDVM